VLFFRANEKIAHCAAVADSVAAHLNQTERQQGGQQAAQQSQHFAKCLTAAFEMLFAMLDDGQQEVRVAAEEATCKMVRVLGAPGGGGHAGRLQVELFKEIKRDGSARRLRSAMAKFACVAGIIRPQKCRAYLTNLLPCLLKASARTEEAVQETLVTAADKIFAALGEEKVVLVAHIFHSGSL